MGFTNPSINNSILVGMRRPLSGRLEISETATSTIIVQWNGTPQSIFVFPE
jgi:hypothetical protein